MHHEMASALAEERRRDLTRQATQWRAASVAAEAGVPVSHVRDTRVPGWRIPRYRVHWSRTTLPAIGAAGRRERSWVIVISATRGL
jgi:hypothetical protein